jgi:hypothetical protein
MLLQVTICGLSRIIHNFDVNDSCSQEYRYSSNREFCHDT